MNKLEICKLIYRKLNDVSLADVISIVDLLIAELSNDIRKGKTVRVHNFGAFETIIYKPKKITNSIGGGIKFSKKRNILRFRLTEKLKNLILDYWK